MLLVVVYDRVSVRISLIHGLAVDYSLLEYRSSSPVRYKLVVEDHFGAVVDGLGHAWSRSVDVLTPAEGSAQ